MILIHVCGKCGHSDLEPRAHPSNGDKTAAELTGNGCGAMQCSCRNHTYGPPATAPSFDQYGRPIERLASPGTKLTNGLTTCPCDACVAAYESNLQPTG